MTNKDTGFSLVEVMVGIVIGVIAIAAAFSSYNYFNKSYDLVSQKAKINKAAREGLAVIARDLRNAGYIDINYDASDKNTKLIGVTKNYLDSKKLKFYTAYIGEEPVGYYEYLNHEDTKEVEITYFGIFKNYYGKKVGGYLLSHALETAWKHSPKRVWVHTCTLDHPNALRNYIARGMNIFKKEAVSVPV